MRNSSHQINSTCNRKPNEEVFFVCEKTIYISFTLHIFERLDNIQFPQMAVISKMFLWDVHIAKDHRTFFVGELNVPFFASNQ